MNKAIVNIAIVFFMVSSAINAKRVAPEAVQPIVYDDVIYSAPHFVAGEKQNGGFIEARSKNDKLLWRIKVYITNYSSNLEKDVQDIFITNIDINNGYLVVTDEAKRTFRVNLITKEVSKK